jgi:hypothetical protein
VGTSDPLEFIEAEFQRIPFKAALSKPHEWQDTFKDWPSPPLGFFGSEGGFFPERRLFLYF